MIVGTQAPCGCLVVASDDHLRGERAYRCGHGRVFVLRVRQVLVGELVGEKDSEEIPQPADHADR